MREANLQRNAKNCLFRKCFPELTTEVQILHWRQFKSGLEGFFRKIKETTAFNEGSC